MGLCLIGIFGTLTLLYSPESARDPAPIVVTPNRIENTSPKGSRSTVPLPTNSGRNTSADPHRTRQVEPLHQESFERGTLRPAEDGPDSRIVRFDNRQMIQRLNYHLRENWKLSGVTPSPVVDDAVWCQRTYRQLIGRAPRPREKTEFLRDPYVDKRQRLVERLLGPEHSASFADHWSERWSTWLLDRSTGRVEEKEIFRIGLAGFLSDALEENRSYDKVCKQMLTAGGTNEPGRDDFDAATNYLLGVLDEEGIEVTAQVCRSMIGHRLRCAQCHDDQQNRILQERFWQMSAVFQNVEAKRYRLGRGRVSDRVGPSAVRFQTPDGNWHITRAAYLDGSSFVSATDSTLREQLADRLLASPQFSQTAVNRIWSELLRYGFTFPIDDLGPHNPVSHPRLVKLLSEQFVAAGFDLRRLIHWVVLSEAFDRSDVVTAGNSKDFPGGGSVALFSRHYVRPSIFGTANDGLDWLVAGGEPQVTNAQDVPHRLLIQGLRSGNTSQQDTKIRMGQLLPISHLRVARSLANRGLSPEQQLHHAFLMTLARPPSDRERTKAEVIFKGAQGDRIVALERIIWVLLNAR